jgi:hypothetical protein
MTTDNSLKKEKISLSQYMMNRSFRSDSNDNLSNNESHDEASQDKNTQSSHSKMSSKDLYRARGQDHKHRGEQFQKNKNMKLFVLDYILASLLFTETYIDGFYYTEFESTRKFIVHCVVISTKNDMRCLSALCYALEANIIYQCVISHLKSSIKKDVENYHALYQSGKATEEDYKTYFNSKIKKSLKLIEELDRSNQLWSEFENLRPLILSEFPKTFKNSNISLVTPVVKTIEIIRRCIKEYIENKGLTDKFTDCNKCTCMSLKKE